MPPSPIDSIRLQVLWNRLQAIVDEQAGALMRTAFSPIVRESGDLSAGIFDRRGRMLAQAVTGTPGHVNTMAAAVANFFPHFPPEAMRFGDIYLTNNPWLGAGHLNDFVLLKPCFANERLVGLAACTSHLVDIGGRCLGPDGRDVYDEGLYVPPMRLVDQGRLDATFMLLLAANSRTPEQARGDLHALIACCEVAEQRLAELARESLIEDLDAVGAHIVEASERATRARIAALPDGRWTNEMTVDGYDFEITLRATLEIAGDSLAIDFAGSSGPSEHGINVPLNYATAYTVFGVKCALAPDIPNNAGALAPFTVTAPAHTIVNAVKPAPVCSRHIVGQLLPDLALGALHRAMPGRLPAEGASTLWDLPIRGGFEPGRRGNATPFVIELVHNGGTGARPDLDGLSATAFPSGVLGSLVEVTESVAPLVFRRRELRPDSGGPGRRRGGLGQVIEIESALREPLELFGTVDRVKHPARGRDGGGDGARGVLALGSGQRFDGKGYVRIPEGERLRVLTPGGAGYGDPVEREPERVAADVRSGRVSCEAAAADYAVIVDAAGRIDVEATRTARAGRLA